MQSELLTRGVSEVVPMEIAKKKLESGKPIRIYLGIDPTGAKLHLGHAVPLRKLQEFVNAGHHVIFLIGGYTAMIGDPSGRDTQRVPLTGDQIEENFKTYKEQASKVLDFSKIEVRNNSEWLSKTSLTEIMSLSTHFTVQQILKRDMYQKRMEKDMPISLQEFLYPLLQGYDSIVLNVDAEIGGNDQLFNMLAGRTLMKEMYDKEKFVMTMKLLEGTDGRKMSKTYDNCIWLDDSAKEMYGKLMSVKDELIATYMECCTDIPMKEIEDAVKQMKKGANPRDFKMKLAKEIVASYHGKEAAESQERQFIEVFSKGGVPDDMQEITVGEGSLLIDVLVKEKLVPSKSEAKRLISQKGITMNEKPVESIEETVQEGVLKVGKRSFFRIRYE